MGRNAYSFPFNTGVRNYQMVRSSTYRTVLTFVFRGTDEDPIRTAFIMINHRSAGNDVFFRIYDSTNNLVICENNTSTTGIMSFDLGALSNLSGGSAVYELQVRNGGGKIRTDIYSLVLG